MLGHAGAASHQDSGELVDWPQQTLAKPSRRGERRRVGSFLKCGESFSVIRCGAVSTQSAIYTTTTNGYLLLCTH